MIGCGGAERPSRTCLVGLLLLFLVASSGGGCGGDDPGGEAEEVVTIRWHVFDTNFLGGRKGTPRIEDIVRRNVEEEMTLRGVFSMRPPHHVDLCTLVEEERYDTVSIPPHRLRAFDDDIYSDVLFRLKDGSVCRVQHSFHEEEGLTIRVVRDQTMAYVRPREADAGEER